MTKNLGAVHLYAFEFFFLSLFPTIAVFIISFLGNYDRAYQAAFTLVVYVFVLSILNGLFLIFASQYRNEVSKEHMGVSHATFASFFFAIILYILQETQLNITTLITAATIPVMFFLPCLIGCFKSTPSSSSHEHINVPVLATRETFFFCALMVPFFHDTENTIDLNKQFSLENPDGDVYSILSIDHFRLYFVVPVTLYVTLVISSFVLVQIFYLSPIPFVTSWISFVSDSALAMLVVVYGILCWTKTGVFADLSDTLFLFSITFYVLASLTCVYSILKRALKLRLWVERQPNTEKIEPSYTESSHTMSLAIPTLTQSLPVATKAVSSFLKINMKEKGL